MNRHLLDLAGEIIRQSDREHPADAVLRSVLKSRRELSSEASAAVSRAVFAFFRWRGWLEERSSIQARLELGLELASAFSRSPGSFADADLIQRAVPRWLGDAMEVPVEWVRSLQHEPTLWLRARVGQALRVATALGGCHVFGQGPWANTIDYRGDLDLFRTPEFHAGMFELQDLSSQAVGLACGARPGQTWWDACAGEGGKLLHLSELMKNQGLIWASDRAAWRLRKLKRRAARAGVFNYRAALWDGGAALPTKTRFDGVLLDAPCSGVGTWHRNPHARWTTRPDDIKELSRLQQQLLARVAPTLKPGGKLVYAVCTLTRQETAEMVDFFQERFPEFESFPMANPLIPSVAGSSQFTLWSQEFGGNGMFVAAWARKSG
jgi:16S rRNA (cytosine967-C5)-methyltransferase